MTDETLPSTPKRSHTRLVVIVLVVITLVALACLLAWREWVAWQVRESHSQAIVAQSEQRIAALEQRIQALRRDQRAQGQRILDAAATNRVLRDEVLGLSQRGALLEDSVSRLADPTRHGPQALRLDEVELLLSQAAQRLDIAGDVEGARRVYVLAAGALQGVDDPRLLNLRQALAQERAALDTLGASAHIDLARRLESFAGAADKLPQRDAAMEPAQRPAWQRVLAPLVDVRPSRNARVLGPSERAAGEAALQIELGLARAALERSDSVAFRSALGRIDGWLIRLWPDTTALRQSRKQLAALRAAPLRPALPVLGSTLQQLRALRNSGVSIPTPSAQSVAAPPPRPEIEP